MPYTVTALVLLVASRALLGAELSWIAPGIRAIHRILTNPVCFDDYDWDVDLAIGGFREKLPPLHDALPAGRLEVHAELRGLVVGPERTNHRAIERALAFDVGLVDRRRARAEDRRVFALNGFEGRLGIGLGLLRRHLNVSPAACDCRRTDRGNLRPFSSSSRRLRLRRK